MLIPALAIVYRITLDLELLMSSRIKHYWQDHEL